MTPEEKRIVAGQFGELKRAVERLDSRVHQLTTAFTAEKAVSDSRINDLESRGNDLETKLDDLAAQSTRILDAVTSLDKRIWDQADHNYHQQTEITRLTAKHSGAGALGGGLVVGVIELVKAYLAK